MTAETAITLVTYIRDVYMDWATPAYALTSKAYLHELITISEWKYLTEWVKFEHGFCTNAEYARMWGARDSKHLVQKHGEAEETLHQNYGTAGVHDNLHKHKHKHKHKYEHD